MKIQGGSVKLPPSASLFKYYVIASEAWQSRGGARLLRHYRAWQRQEGKCLAKTGRKVPGKDRAVVIASEAWQSRGGASSPAPARG